MGWDRIVWVGMGTGCGEYGWDVGVGRDGMGWDGMGRGGIVWDGMGT